MITENQILSTKGLDFDVLLAVELELLSNIQENFFYIFLSIYESYASILNSGNHFNHESFFALSSLRLNCYWKEEKKILTFLLGKRASCNDNASKTLPQMFIDSISNVNNQSNTYLPRMLPFPDKGLILLGALSLELFHVICNRQGRSNTERIDILLKSIKYLKDNPSIPNVMGFKILEYILSNNSLINPAKIEYCASYLIKKIMTIKRVNNIKASKRFRKLVNNFTIALFDLDVSATNCHHLLNLLLIQFNLINFNNNKDKLRLIFFSNLIQQFSEKYANFNLLNIILDEDRSIFLSQWFYKKFPVGHMIITNSINNLVEHPSNADQLVNIFLSQAETSTVSLRKYYDKYCNHYKFKEFAVIFLQKYSDFAVNGFLARDRTFNEIIEKLVDTAKQNKDEKNVATLIKLYFEDKISTQKVEFVFSRKLEISKFVIIELLRLCFIQLGPKRTLAIWEKICNQYLEYIDAEVINAALELFLAANCNAEATIIRESCQVSIKLSALNFHIVNMFLLENEDFDTAMNTLSSFPRLQQFKIALIYFHLLLDKKRLDCAKVVWEQYIKAKFLEGIQYHRSLSAVLKWKNSVISDAETIDPEVFELALCYSFHIGDLGTAKKATKMISITNGKISSINYNMIATKREFHKIIKKFRIIKAIKELKYNIQGNHCVHRNESKGSLNLNFLLYRLFDTRNGQLRDNHANNGIAGVSWPWKKVAVETVVEEEIEKPVRFNSDAKKSITLPIFSTERPS